MNKHFRKILTGFTLIVILTNVFAINLQSKSNFADKSELETKSEDYDLLIISPSEFIKSLEPLVCHKNKHDIQTKLVDTDEVYAQIYWQGKDKAEKVKYYIKEAIENWGIKYVLLVGGRKDQSSVETWWVPVRYSHLYRNYARLKEKQFLTDLYFADIYDNEGNFSSWDNNENGIFGEWFNNESATDIPDLYPDISVGRLPCQNIFQVKNIVKKIIRYETGQADESWFKRMIVVAGDTYPTKTEYYDGEVYTQQGLDLMNDFEPIKLWASDGSLKNGFNVIRAMNHGSGFIWFSGHGNAGGWSTHSPNNKEEMMGHFELFHMLFLRNRHKLPVCISGSGCFNNMFNVTLGYSFMLYWRSLFRYHVPFCWGWALTKKVGGGAISVIASTAFSYESPDVDSYRGGCELLDRGFFEEYKSNDTLLLGDYWKNSITSFLDGHPINWEDTSATGDALIVKNAEQWLLIGDPSLKIGGYPN